MRYTSYKNAKQYAHSLNLKRRREWYAYHKKNKIPENIPLYAKEFYKFETWADFLGYNIEIINPELVKEWHLTKNKELPCDIKPGCHDKKWWICLKNHKHKPWQATVKNRHYKKSGCPTCWKEKQKAPKKTEEQQLVDDKKLLIKIGIAHKITTKEEWYENTSKKLLSHNIVEGASTMLNRYKHSPIKCVSTLLSKDLGKFETFLFKKVPNNYWKKKENRKEYFVWLEKILKYKKPGDWYQIDKSCFDKNKGNSLLQKYYKGSAIKAVMDNVDNPNGWEKALFKNAPLNFWDDITNQKKWLLKVGEEKGYTCSEDWYQLESNDLRNFRETSLHTLLGKYDYSPSKLVEALITPPEGGWLPFKFTVTRMGWWKKRKNRKLYFDWLVKELNIQDLETIYLFTHHTYEDFHGAGFIDYYDTLVNAAKDMVPNFNWEEDKFCVDNKNQKILFEIIKKLYPNDTIIYEHKFNHLRYENGKDKKSDLSVDIFIKNKNIVIEYNGIQHYKHISFFGGKEKFHEQKKRDKEKELKLIKDGKAFIVIPYWEKLNLENIKKFIDNQFIIPNPS